MAKLIEDVERSERNMIARENIKRHGVKAEINSLGNLTFVIPGWLEEKLHKEYNFSVEMLNVGGNIALADLAVHLDEQPSLEAHAGMIAEWIRYQLKQKQDEFDLWYEKIFYKVKTHMVSSGEKSVTDKGVTCRIAAKYGEEMSKQKKEINELEFQYRMANNVIRSSLITKGTLLPTLRNIIQGKSQDGIGEIESAEAIRFRLKPKSKKEK